MIAFIKKHSIAIVFSCFFLFLGYSVELLEDEILIINNQALVNAEGRLGTLEMFMLSVCADNMQYFCEIRTD